MPFIVNIPYILCSKELPNSPRQHKLWRNDHPKHQLQPIPSRFPFLSWWNVRMDCSPCTKNCRRQATPDDPEQGSFQLVLAGFWTQWFVSDSQAISHWSASGIVG